MHNVVLLSLVASAALSGCASRTQFATHPKSSAQFEPTKSDAKAVEIADAVIAALGGQDRWMSAKEIQWKQEVKQDGKVALAGHHAWDRWNGRHYAKLLTGDPIEVMYSIYEEGSGVAMVGNNRLDAASKDSAIQQARKRWAEDSAMLLLPLLLKSPGVTLKYKGEVAGNAGVEPTCHDIQVNFDTSDSSRPDTTYHLIVDKASNLPVRFEIERGGPDKLLAYSFDEWTEVGGLKIAQLRQNLGFKAETVHFSEIQVSSEPDEALYTPQIR